MMFFLVTQNHAFESFKLNEQEHQAQSSLKGIDISEESPLYQEITNYLDLHSDEIARRELDLVDQGRNLSIVGGMNHVGINFTKGFGTFSIELKREVAPDLFHDERWLVTDTFNIYIDLNIGKIFTSKNTVPDYILKAHELQEITFYYEDIKSNKLSQSELNKIFNHHFISHFNIKNYRHRPDFSVLGKEGRLRVNATNIEGKPSISVYFWDDFDSDDPYKFERLILTAEENEINLSCNSDTKYITYSVHLREGEHVTINKFNINNHDFINPNLV